MTTAEATVTDGAPEQVRLAITGMTCASCSARIERKLGKVPGVESATVNLATEKAFVSFSAPVTVEQIVAEVQKTGYGASVIGAPPTPRSGMPSGELPGAGALLGKLRSRHPDARAPRTATTTAGRHHDAGQGTARPAAGSTPDRRSRSAGRPPRAHPGPGRHPAAARRRGGPHGAGLPPGHGAAVLRRQPLAPARPRHARRLLVRVALPPGRRRQRPPPRLDDGHSRVDRRARGLGLLRRRAAARGVAPLLRGRGGRHDLPAHRPVPRGAGQGLRQGRAAVAARPRRQGRRRAAHRPAVAHHERGPHPRRPARRRRPVHRAAR